MKREIKIQINEPCHENWNDMTDVEKGRFCGVCSKVVVDFTQFSDAQLFDYFSKKRTDVSEKLCGRFAAEKVIVPQKIEVPEISYYQMQNGVQRFLWLLVVSLGFVVVSCGNDSEIGKAEIKDTTISGTAVIKQDTQINDNEENGLKSRFSAPVEKIQGEIVETLTGEPETIVMGGVEPPHELMGDTVVYIHPENPNTIKGKIAFPVQFKDSVKIKKGE